MILKNFSNWINSLTESSNSKYDYGCAMIYYDFPEISKIHSSINKDDIYLEDGDNTYGLEDEPHTTLLYGFHGDVTPDEVFGICRDFDYSALTLHNCSCFNNQDYDVLKFDVDNDALYKINNKLTSIFSDRYTTNYPDYHPHSTIGYIKKGKGQHYADLFKNKSYIVTPKKLVYSMSNGDKHEMTI